MDAENRPASYVVLEQNANWMINNFTTISSKDGELQSRLYLVDKNNNICSDDEVPEEDLELSDHQAGIERLGRLSDPDPGLCPGIK